MTDSVFSPTVFPYSRTDYSRTDSLCGCIPYCSRTVSLVCVWCVGVCPTVFPTPAPIHCGFGTGVLFGLVWGFGFPVADNIPFVWSMDAVFWAAVSTPGAIGSPRPAQPSAVLAIESAVYGFGVVLGEGISINGIDTNLMPVSRSVEAVFAYWDVGVFDEPACPVGAMSSHRCVLTQDDAVGNG